jgi:hypothetical protein
LLGVEALADTKIKSYHFASLCVSIITYLVSLSWLHAVTKL